MIGMVIVCLLCLVFFLFIAVFTIKELKDINTSQAEAVITLQELIKDKDTCINSIQEESSKQYSEIKILKGQLNHAAELRHASFKNNKELRENMAVQAEILRIAGEQLREKQAIINMLAEAEVAALYPEEVNE